MAVSVSSANDLPVSWLRSAVPAYQAALTAWEPSGDRPVPTQRLTASSAGGAQLAGPGASTGPSGAVRVIVASQHFHPTPLSKYGA
ncbi:hypothetical protein WJX72_011128 [[Myrmecia] bisecta]|uniref:Uncharacterized protein n=1 Tax=[Myrmecia] bisecta TaxID=41462 RepID=A0AAW1PM75_9CHLO